MAETYFELTSRERATEGPLVVEVHGLEELQKALKDFGGDWQQIANEALMPGMATLESEAKKLAPVDTGRLRASIGSEVTRTVGSEIVGKVGSNIEYASYQEYGTRYQSGKPYMRPALEGNLDRVLKLFEEGIVKALRKLRLSD